MAHYLITDLANVFFRAIHQANRTTDAEERVAFAIHCTLQSINAAYRDLKTDHLVIALEGHSWRKDFYKPYKADRVVARAAKSEAEKEADALYFQGLNDLTEFFREKTNATVLHDPMLEGDDLVGGWIQGHPNDQHTINSTDTDYYQLLSESVTQYNGITQEKHTIRGIFDKKGKYVIDKKTKLPKMIPDPAYILFTKIVRGDPTDNVFSAYPGVREKGTKNKIGILEAYEDRNSKGFAYNNFMLSRWVDHNDVEHRVLDDFHRNRILIDLTAQPADIRDRITAVVSSATAKNKPMVGAHFLKFCGKYDLVKLSENAASYGVMLGSNYQPNK